MSHLITLAICIAGGFVGATLRTWWEHAHPKKGTP